MSAVSNINFFTTLLTSGCVCFAASNFGIKLGKLVSFENTTGYKYIFNSTYKKDLYKSIIEKDKPDFAKDADALEKWCLENQKSAIKWKDVSRYCLVKNNIRHQLIDKGYTIKTGNEDVQNYIKCSEFLDSYSDDSGESLNYLLGRNKCAELKVQTTSHTASS